MSNFTLGICGSGQLSMMLCQAAKKLNINTIVLSETNEAPAKNYCDELFVCDFRDKDKIKLFSSKIDCATLEFENFNFETLKLIEEFKPVYPRPEINLIVQNRKLEKEFFKKLNIPTTNYAIINNQEDLKKNEKLFPGLLKSITGGYDGHLSYKLETMNDVNKYKIDFSKIYIFEKKVEILKEFSIIASRYQNKKINIFEPFENFHSEQILRETIVPANIPEEIKYKATEYTKKILTEHDYIGIISVEFFIDKEQNLLVNETASRVHNSGHITINTSNSSQFDQHIRAVCNLNFVKLEKMKRGKMINILGRDILEYRKKNFSHNEFFFDYQKKEARSKRKMGHINILDNV